ncbi:hypothetical protein ABXN37_12180 [Piscinibacter sakaiensis]|uniref:UDP-N-acetylmuramate--alanine ligase n=1 Tax=Piscinibacter sakaiensis TaxID=1547922 RepID=A0A0K8P041_PISS1|nr:hypothetical protein [Piscinibacter sakaiensis]GAP35904.1 UDP-N-acetylmuramate--alanine ligase [Piscinibacter sakaiensis]
MTTTRRPALTALLLAGVAVASAAAAVLMTWSAPAPMTVVELPRVEITGRVTPQVIELPRVVVTNRVAPQVVELPRVLVTNRVPATEAHEAPVATAAAPVVIELPRVVVTGRPQLAVAEAEAETRWTARTERSADDGA